MHYLQQPQYDRNPLLKRIIKPAETYRIIGISSSEGERWTGQLFVDISVAIIDGKDRGVYEQQSAVHG